MTRSIFGSIASATAGGSDGREGAFEAPLKEIVRGVVAPDAGAVDTAGVATAAEVVLVLPVSGAPFCPAPLRAELGMTVLLSRSLLGFSSGGGGAEGAVGF